MYIGPEHGTAFPETTPLSVVAALALDDMMPKTKIAEASTSNARFTMGM